MTARQRKRLRAEGTDWRRFAVAAPLGMLMAAGTLWATAASGAVPTTFAVSGNTFTVTAKYLEGQNAVQYASVVSGTKGEQHPVAVAVIESAQITGLCEFASTSTPLGPVSFVVRSDGKEPVMAKGLVLDMSRVQGHLRFGQVRMGQDAATLDVPSAVRGRAGTYGQQAQTLSIEGMRLRTWSLTAGSLSLKSASMFITREENPCD